MNRLPQRESDPFRPATSLREPHYAPRNRDRMTSLSHSLASIHLSAIGS